MISKILAGLTLWLLLFAVTYGLFAFAYLNTNALEWNGFARLVLLLAPTWLTLSAIHATWLKR